MGTPVYERKQWKALNYTTYAEAKEKFKWSDRWEVFDGTKDNFNITHECVDRHPKDDYALRIKFDTGATESYTFGQLSRYTSQFANMLVRLGIGEGDRVAVMLFPSIEFYVTLYGVEEAQQIVKDLSNAAIEKINKLPGEKTFFLNLINQLEVRNK